ncbi:MAG: bifunctional methylenetetrahydrofolate dehydrogenase/methenyltetrahydrofolate cyclohydrolase FolD [Pseudomonadota bacterium]
MSALILDGKAFAAVCYEKLKPRVAQLINKGYQPGLAVVLIGGNPASQIYVRHKIQSCENLGVRSFSVNLPENVTMQEVLNHIQELNASPNVHGILVQLPLPKHLDADLLIEAIQPEKDVDGFHPWNVGCLVLGKQALYPCTPYGVMRLLEHYDIPLRGQEAVVIGTSNIVGKPMARFLQQAGATVTLCNSKTRDVKAHTRRADIVVAAVGKPSFITGEDIREGAVIIDVGINRLESGKVVGDIEFETVSKKAGWVTPVPGGVGPMTVAMLVENTVLAAERISGLAGN